MEKELFRRKTFKKLRKDKNLTQAEIASRIGIDQSFVSKVERGIEYPSLKTINLMSVVLDVAATELIGNDDCERGETDC